MAELHDIYTKAVEGGMLSKNVTEDRFSKMLQDENERKAYYEYVQKKNPNFYSSDYAVFSQNAASLFTGQQPVEQPATPTRQPEPEPERKGASLWQRMLSGITNTPEKQITEAREEQKAAEQRQEVQQEMQSRYENYVNQQKANVGAAYEREQPITNKEELYARTGIANTEDNTEPTAQNLAKLRQERAQEVFDRRYLNKDGQPKDSFAKDLFENWQAGVGQIALTPYKLLETAENFSLDIDNAVRGTNFQPGTGTATRFANEVLGGNYLRSRVEHFQKESDRYQDNKGITETAIEGDLGTAAGKAVLATVQSAPNLAVSIYSGKKGMETLGGMFLGATAALQKYDELKDREDIGAKEKAGAMFGAFVAECVPEIIGAKRYGKMFNQKTVGAVRQEVQKEVLKAWDKFLNSKFVKGMGDAWNWFMKWFGEGATESLTDLMNRAIDKALGIKKEFTTSDKLGVVDSFIIGQLSDVGPASVHLYQRSRYRNQVEQEILSNPSLSAVVMENNISAEDIADIATKAAWGERLTDKEEKLFTDYQQSIGKKMNEYAGITSLLNSAGVVNDPNAHAIFIGAIEQSGKSQEEVRAILEKDAEERTPEEQTYLETLPDLIKAEQQRLIDESNAQSEAAPVSQAPEQPAANARREQIQREVENEIVPGLIDIAFKSGDGQENPTIYRVSDPANPGRMGYIVAGEVAPEPDTTSNPDKVLWANGNATVTVRWDDSDKPQMMALKDVDFVEASDIDSRIQTETDRRMTIAQGRDMFAKGDKVRWSYVDQQDGLQKTAETDILNVTDDGVVIAFQMPNGAEETTTVDFADAMQNMQVVEKAPSQEEKTQAPEKKPAEKPDIDLMTADELGAATVEYLGEKPAAIAWLQMQLEKARRNYMVANNKRPVNADDIDEFKRQNDALQRAKKEAQAIVSKLEAAVNAASAYKTAEEMAEAERAEAARRAKYEARQKTEEAMSGSEPAVKWNSKPRVQGNAVTRTLPDGTKIAGHYVLAEAGTATPSHDPFNNWNTSNGFPTTKDGRNINDRDYKNDKDAQSITEQIARTYDGQAVEQVPVVSNEGIVYDGNGRTIAGNIAAANNTDAAYLEALKENAANFGFTPEQLAQFEHPRVYMQLDENLPYSTQTFAMFNQQEKKSQSSANRAVANSKKLSEAARDGILQILEAYGTLDTFFASESAAKEVVTSLLNNGIITQQEVAGLTENTDNGYLLSPAGKDAITDLLIGALFDEETIRMLGNDKGLKQSILRALPSIVENRKLEEYALTDNIRGAIRLLYEARQAGMDYKLYVLQGNAFDGYVKDRFSAFEMLMAEEMTEGVEQFRQTLNLYNNSAKDEVGGQSGLFESRSPEDIKNDILTYYGKEANEQPAERAATGSGSEETGNVTGSTPAGNEKTVAPVTTAAANPEENGTNFVGEKPEAEVPEAEQPRWTEKSLSKPISDDEKAQVLKDIDDGVTKIVVVNNDNILQRMTSEGISESIIQNVLMALANGSTINGFYINGKVFLNTEELPTALDIVGKYVHERQHELSRIDGKYVREVMRSMTASELADRLRVLSESNFYDMYLESYENAAEEDDATRERSHSALADELISHLMENIYTSGKSVEDVCSKFGIDNERVINIINTINNEQRQSIRLSRARRSSLINASSEGAVTENARDTETRPESELVRTGFGPLESSNQGTERGKEVTSKQAERKNADEVETGGALVSQLEKMGVPVSTDLEANREALKKAKSDKSEAGKTHYYKTQSGEQYGFSYKGRIYLDPRKVDANLPLHEYGHLWSETFRILNPKGWQQIVETLKKDTDAWTAVQQLRPDLTNENDLAEEVIATYSGEKGSQRLREELKRMATRDSRYESKWQNVFRNISKAIQDFWKAVGDFLHIEYQSADQVYDQVLKDFVEGTNPRKRVEDYLNARNDEYMQAAEAGDIAKATAIFNEALQENIGNGITPYLSVGDYNNLKALAKNIKKREPEVVEQVAQMMAPLIPDNAVIIPAPSHIGRATDMLDLANAISKITGSEVADVLQSGERKSQYAVKKETGVPMTSANLGISLNGEVPDGKVPVIIDNVVDSGNTAEACVRAVGKGIVVSLANSAEAYRHASTLKSAAPVLRDRNGNIVPLNKRFDLNGSKYLGKIDSPLFSIGGTHNVPIDENTLVGIHNIGIDKLRKAFKLGGLANPSVAVIDIAKQNHEDYGAVSFILPSSMVDSRTGHNAGTYTGDIWSPTYPYVQRKMTDKGIDKYYKTMDEVFSDPELRDLKLDTELTYDNWIDDQANPMGFAYWYMLEKGLNPETIYYNSGISDEIKAKIRPLWEKYNSVAEMSPEERMTVLEVAAEMNNTTTEALIQDAQKMRNALQESLAKEDKDAPAWKLKFRQDQIDLIDHYGMDYSVPKKAFEEVSFAIKNDGKIDVNLTKGRAMEYVRENAKADFDKWVSDFDKRFDIKEVIFNGYDYNGNRKYLPNTLNVASRLMNREKMQNAYDNGGLSPVRALLMQRLTSLAQIRKNKDKLRPMEEGDADSQAWEAMKSEWFDKIISPLSDWTHADDNSFINMDIGEKRLLEALETKDPIGYMNREYGYHIAKYGEFAKDLKDLTDRIKDLPTKYFETKFNRPVYIDEFAAAVIPQDLPEDLREGLTKAGLDLYEYDQTKEGSRREATLKASEGDGIRFSITYDPLTDEKLKESVVSEMQNIQERALADGTYLKAPNGADTNLSERQWLQVRTESFKRMYGDWENDPKNATKVLDENGEPRVVYHGTRSAGFKAFEKNVQGIYFADYDTASWYSDEDNPKLYREIPNIKSWEKAKEITDKLGISFEKANEEEYDNAYIINGKYVFDLDEARDVIQSYRVYSGNAGSVYACFLNIRSPKVYNYEGHGALDGFRGKEEPSVYFERIIQAQYGKKPTYDGLICENIKDFGNIGGGLAELDEGGRLINYYDNTVYAVINPNQIKSATDNDGSFSEDNDDFRFSLSNQNEEMFFSNAERAVENIKQEKATPEQWRAMIEKAGGLKAGEDKWIGLSDWLKSQRTAGVEPKRPDETTADFAKRVSGHKATLTKQEVLDYVRSNKIQIEETNYGGDGKSIEDTPAFKAYQEEYQQLFDKAYKGGGIDGWMKAAEDAMEEMMERHGGDDFGMAFWGDQRTLRVGDINAALYFITMDGSTPPINDVRLGYTTNGLDNKREIALTVPTIESYDATDEVHFGDADDGRAIAWARFGDAKDVDGNKVLVLDEVQSKRHQDAREKGYRDESIKARHEELERKSNDAAAAFREFQKQKRDEYGYDLWYLTGEDQELARNDFDFSNVNQSDVEKYTELLAARNMTSDEVLYDVPAAKKNNEAIPVAPFEKNWHELVMKRMLRFAAENGYNKMAWTTGQQQIDRYNLADKIEQLTVFYNDETGLYDVFVVPKGESVSDRKALEYGIDDKRLRDVLGKSMYDRVMEQGKAEGWMGPVEITGDNLQIGGDGMIGFYDDILPRFMQKYGKKWGVQVGTVNLPDIYDDKNEKWGETMHAVDITPEMVQSVLQGQPMFSVAQENEAKRVAADIWQQYQNDGKLESIRDVAEYAEANMPVNKDTQRLFDAINTWRAEEAEDRELYGERGDLEPFENAILDEVEQLMKSDNPVIYSKNFKNWFGDWENDPENASKVVDKNGKPMVVFHRTWGEFTEFDPVKISSATDFGAFGKGFYFSKNDYVLYGNKKMAVFLNLRNPMRLDQNNAWKVKSGYIDNKYGEFDNNASIRMTEDLKAKGYDGVIYDNGFTHEVVAYYPNQIKSATDNNGEFGPLNSSILFSVSPKENETRNEFIRRAASEQKLQTEMGDNPLVLHYQELWDEAETPEKRDAILDQFIKRLAGDTVRFKVSRDKGEMYQFLLDNGYSEELAKIQLTYALKKNFSGWRLIGGSILFNGNNIDSMERTREIVVHEQQHTYNKEYTGIPMIFETILNSIPEELAYFLRVTRNGNTGYESLLTLGAKGFYHLTEEVLAFGVQFCYEAPAGVDVKQYLQDKGIYNETIINLIYNEYERQRRENPNFYSQHRWWRADRDNDVRDEEGRGVDVRADEKESEEGYGRRTGGGTPISVIRERLWQFRNDPVKLEQLRNDAIKIANIAISDEQSMRIIAQMSNPLSGASASFSVSNSPNSLTRSEMMTKSVVEHSKGSYQQMMTALKHVGNDIKKAMKLQNEFDKAQVESLLNLATTLLREHWGASSTNPTFLPNTMANIITQVRNAVGKEDVSKEVGTIMDYLVDAQKRAAANEWSKLLNTKIQKLNISGVVSQGKVALQGQYALKALNEALRSSMTVEQMEEQIAELSDAIANAQDESTRTQLNGKMIGYVIAAQHLERIQQLQQEYQQLRDELTNVRASKAWKPEARQQLVDAIHRAMRENSLQQADAFMQSASDLQGYIEEQHTAAKDFIDKMNANREKIRQFAANDLSGTATNPNRLRTKNQVIRQIWDAFSSPIRDLQSLLRMVGLHAPDGEGYLYNHFMRGWTDAADTERTGIVNAQETLDSKVADLTKGKYKTWVEVAEAIKNKSHDMFTVRMFNGVNGEGMPISEELTLDAGNALYIYAVNKMTDGEMKLRAMNITDEDVETLKNAVKEKFGQEILDLVDWVQSEYFVQLRNRYNPTHEALFGAPMDAIDNYFPLRINPNARQKNEDVGDPDTDAARLLTGTTTGAIKRRTRNSLMLDVRNADFFQEVIRHVAQMERWNAFAQWTRDANILFSDINFRNRVKSLNTIYGTGDKLYNYMKDAFKVAVGTYRPNRDTFSEFALNIAKGATSAKINYRLFTALKQFASFPAFFTYATDMTFVDSFVQNIFHPHDTMHWAKKNMPNFEKREKKRDMGDMRLMQRTTDWQWNKKILEQNNKYGMAANVGADLLTCSTGARAAYDSRVKKYLDYGYAPDAAAERAIQDAEMAFNTSQQSSEGAYVAPVQMDRNLITAALTVFRTSPIQYTRNFFRHAIGLWRKIDPDARKRQIEFRKGQYIYDGLTEEQATAAAENDYKKSIMSDTIGVAVYGTILNIIWRLAGQLPYLIFGDDDDKKKELAKDAVTGGALISPFTGLLGGGIIEQAIDGYGSFADVFSPDMPFTQDLKKAVEYAKNDKYAEAANMALSVLMQSSTAFDPQTAAEMVMRTVTTLDSEADLDAAEKAWQVTSAVLSIPQSQYEQLLVDKVINDDSQYDAVLKDYTRYQKIRTAPLTWYLRSEEQDEKAEDGAKKRLDKLIKERRELTEEEE